MPLRESSARRILGLPGSATPYGVVPVGWPNGHYGPTTLNRSGVTHLDGYGNRLWLNS
jgi:hypothetical protein